MDKNTKQENISQQIVCAAIRRESDGTVICAPRHFDTLMRHLIVLSIGEIESWKTAEQGFVDQFGTFLTREEAYLIAKAQNQIIRRCGGDDGKLFSENLY